MSGSSFATKAQNFIEHGFFKVEANGVNAHIELDSTFSAGLTSEFSREFAAFGIPGFQVRPHLIPSYCVC